MWYYISTTCKVDIHQTRGMLHTNLKIMVDYFESYIWCYNHVVNQRNMVKFYTAHSSTAAVSNVKSNHVFVIRFFIKMFIFPMRFDWKTSLSEVSQVLDCIHSVRFTAYIQLHLKIQTTPGQRGASLFLGTHGMRITGGGSNISWGMAMYALKHAFIVSCESCRRMFEEWGKIWSS